MMALAELYARLKATVQIKMWHNTTITQGEASLLSSNCATQCVSDTDTLCQPSQETIADNTVQMELSATASTNTSQDIQVNRTLVVNKIAKLLSYKRFPITYIKEIVTIVKSNLDKASTKLTGYCRTIKTGTDASVSVSECKDGFVASDSITNEIIATALSADGVTPTYSEDIDVELTANTLSCNGEITSVQSDEGLLVSTKLAQWIDPTLENGVLTLRSVYSAEQTDDVLEVI